MRSSRLFTVLISIQVAPSTIGWVPVGAPSLAIDRLGSGSSLRMQGRNGDVSRGRGRGKVLPGTGETTCDYYLEYDMIIVGGGASGLFASGASTMLGAKTLLLEKTGSAETVTAIGNDAIEAGLINDEGDFPNIGGDCTNAACVPSKAVRSVARMAAAQNQIGVIGQGTGTGGTSDVEEAADSRTAQTWLSLARQHATETVRKVRAREAPREMVARNPKLDVALISNAYFVTPHEMRLEVHHFYPTSTSLAPNATNLANELNATNTATTRLLRVRGKKFLIATGAMPYVPKKLESSARRARLPLYTYRTFLRPSGSKKNNAIWQLLGEPSTFDANISTVHNSTPSLTKRIVIAGGGATACELGQALARLGKEGGRGMRSLEIHVVAPQLLAGEDVTLQNAAYQLLSANDNLHFHLGQRLEDVLPDGSIQLSNNGSQIANVSALLLCLGRRPDLRSLRLDNANIEWNTSHGVLVHHSTLRSVTASHVFACGDCASAVAMKPTSRTATHAGWTGYYAALNALLPRFLTFGSQRAVSSTVPRVIFTDPELASVGMSLQECIRRFGMDGFNRLFVSEDGTDRADIESLERQTTAVGFVELRATKVDGRILGFTACGLGASELANEMAVVIGNRLTAQDVAKSLHSYPSFGYLLHRAALSLAFTSIWGLLEACGPVGALLASPGRWVSTFLHRVHTMVKQFFDRSGLTEWQAEGASKGILQRMASRAGDHAREGRSSTATSPSKSRIVSFLDAGDYVEHLSIGRLEGSNQNSCDVHKRESDMNLDDFKSWVARGPAPSSDAAILYE